MKILNMDGSEFGVAPAWLRAKAPPIGHTLVVRDIAFVHRPAGLRFYAPRDRGLWQALVGSKGDQSGFETGSTVL